MAIEQNLKTVTFLASADLSALQFTAVKCATGAAGSATKIAAFAADTDIPLGILQNTPTSGQAAIVAVSGVSKMVSSGSIAVGAIVHGSSTGRATAIAGSKYIIGQVVDTAAADGEYLSVNLTLPGIVHA